MQRQAPEETEHKSLWISAHARCQGGLQRWAGQSSVHRHRWRCSLTRPDRLRALHLASSCLRCHVCALRQVILLQVEEDHVAEYVNGEPELERVERFEIDLEKRTYRDDSGEGRFNESEDLPKIQTEVQALFTRAAKATLLKPKRVVGSKSSSTERACRLPLPESSLTCKVKNYTKPNILLLGPTGSGKTYLLRNLAAARLDSAELSFFSSSQLGLSCPSVNGLGPHWGSVCESGCAGLRGAKTTSLGLRMWCGLS